MSAQPSAASIVAQDKRRRLQRRRRWFIAMGVVAGLLLFGFFGLPPIIRAQAMKRLSAELHREVTIDKIRLDPLVLSITIEGLAIKDRDGQAFTGWKRLYVNFDSFSVFTGEWHFQEIDLEGFSQRVAIAKDGTFNFADLIPAPVAPTEPPAPAPSKPRPLRVTKLKVHSAALTFSDGSRARPFSTQVGPLSFELNEFLTAGDPKAPYAFSAVTESGETFAWQGTVGIDPPRSAGSFKVGKVALKKYAPYYAELINADLLDGLLDVSASYSIDLHEETKQLTLSDAKIALTSLKIAARDSLVPLVDMPSFIIEGLSADGLKTTATIRRVVIDGGRLTVVREADGSINLLNLLPKPAAPDAAVVSAAGVTAGTAPVAAMALPDVKLAEFALTGLAIDMEDRTTPTPARNAIERLDLSLKNVSLSEGAAPIAMQLGVTFAPGGTVSVQGDATREPLAANFAVKVDALPLAGITPYVEPFLNLRIAGGTVSVDGAARLQGAVAAFTGDVSVDKFVTVDGKIGDDFVKFTRFAIRGIDATSEPLAAKIGSIELVDPLARISVHADKTTNLDTILRKDAAPAPKPTPAVSAPAPAATPVVAVTLPGPVWSLGKFTLTNGKAMVTDNSVKPAARLALDQFSGTVSGLSSAAPARADVDIHGKFNGTGKIAITGKLDARAITPVAGALTEVTIDVKGLDLAAISPYVGTYAGYELARSGLTVDVKTRLTQRKVDSDNVVTLNQFTLGAPTNSPDATKLPVRLGVALLKDIDGNIVIPLPVKGSLDDPEFKIGRLVLNVVVNLLVKAATSPFSLIGGAFGGGGDDLAFQQFDAGAVLPAAGEAVKIDTLRKALKGRPALSLDITGSYDADADLAAVRMKILDKQVRYRLWEELRVKNPDTPQPAELTVSPEDEARIIGLFVVERFPSGIPADVSQVTLLTPTSSPPPVVVKKSVRPVSRNKQNVFTGRPPTRTPADAPKPVVFATADSASAATAESAAPTLADARLKLAAAIPVEDDQLRALADERAHAVRLALLAGGEIDEARLLLTPTAPEPKGARVLLQLR